MMTSPQMFENDPFGAVKRDQASTAPTAREVNRFHSNSDRDNSSLAQHHTLGPNRDQAAPGNHQHNNSSSLKLGTGLGLSISGTKGSVTSEDSIVNLLKNFLDFTDNRTP